MTELYYGSIALIQFKNISTSVKFFNMLLPGAENLKIEFFDTIIDRQLKVSCYSIFGVVVMNLFWNCCLFNSNPQENSALNDFLLVIQFWWFLDFQWTLLSTLTSFGKSWMTKLKILCVWQLIKILLHFIRKLKKCLPFKTKFYAQSNKNYGSIVCLIIGVNQVNFLR
jgi:C4-dicarboxylate transporter